MLTDKDYIIGNQISLIKRLLDVLDDCENRLEFAGEHLPQDCKVMCGLCANIYKPCCEACNFKSRYMDIIKEYHEYEKMLMEEIHQCYGDKTNDKDDKP